MDLVENYKFILYYEEINKFNYIFFDINKNI